MERPWEGKGACKLELFGDVRSLDDRLGKEKRKEIAGLIRQFLVQRCLPAGAKDSIGSTIVRCHIRVPRIVNVATDTPDNAALYSGEIDRIIAFASLLDAGLSDWVAGRQE